MKKAFKTILLWIFVLPLACSKSANSESKRASNISLKVNQPGANDPVLSTEVGNGGDLIYCRPDPPQFDHLTGDGWYLFDYAEDRGGGHLKYKDYKTLGETLQDLRLVIDKGAPELLDSFEQYLSQVPFESVSENHGSIQKAEIDRVWVPQKKNENIYDENFFFIPPACRSLGKPGFELHQVVVRNEELSGFGVISRIVYNYDPLLVENIGAKPLQMSMLLFHEWLWDFYSDDRSRELRMANRTLHSKNALTFSKSKIRALIYDTSPSGRN